MKKVVIMRGIPGSGKDSYIQKRFGGLESVLVCSADDFFARSGEYCFDPSRLGEAHAMCFRAFLEALVGGYGVIVVSNTNIRRWEYANYIAVAELMGYGVEIVEMQVETIEQAGLCANRNVHGVPVDVVLRMALEFEKDSRATKVKIFSDSGKAGAIYPCNDEG